MYKREEEDLTKEKKEKMAAKVFAESDERTNEWTKKDTAQSRKKSCSKSINSIDSPFFSTKRKAILEREEKQSSQCIFSFSLNNTSTYKIRTRTVYSIRTSVPTDRFSCPSVRPFCPSQTYCVTARLHTYVPHRLGWRSVVCRFAFLNAWYACMSGREQLNADSASSYPPCSRIWI